MEQEWQEYLQQMMAYNRAECVALWLLGSVCAVVFSFFFTRGWVRGRRRRDAVLLSAYLIGAWAAVWAAFWLVCAVLFALGNQPISAAAFYPIASAPRWIFLFAPLVLLGLNKRVKRLLGNDRGEFLDRMWDRAWWMFGGS